MTWNRPWAPAPELTLGSPHDSRVITTATKSTGRPNLSPQRSISGVQRRTDSGNAGEMDDGDSVTGAAASAAGTVAAAGPCAAAQADTTARATPSKDGMATAGLREGAGGRTRRGREGEVALRFRQGVLSREGRALAYGSHEIAIAQSRLCRSRTSDAADRSGAVVGERQAAGATTPPDARRSRSDYRLG